MSKTFSSLDNKHATFIQKQHLFFVGTAAQEGLVNLSPKGMDSLRVLDESTVVWLNLTGSGNETAAHLKKINRMTIMFCSFTAQPLILRLYGSADTIHARDPQWDELIKLFPADNGARQIFKLHIDLVQTSCGYAVPFYDYVNERPTLQTWSKNKGTEGIDEYWKEKNRHSLDGYDTGLFLDDE